MRVMKRKRTVIVSLFLLFREPFPALIPYPGPVRGVGMRRRRRRHVWRLQGVRTRHCGGGDVQEGKSTAVLGHSQARSGLVAVRA